jgi:predicted dehydrogenase
LRVEEVAADFRSYVEGRQLEDNAHVMIRFSDGATGMMWNSYIAAGMDNGLKLRFFGESGGLEWDHERPNQLTLYQPGKRAASLRRRAACPTRPRRRLRRVLRGHLSTARRRDRRQAPPRDGPASYPSVADGADGVRFVAGERGVGAPQLRVGRAALHVTRPR